MSSQLSTADDSTLYADMLPADPFRSLYVHFGMLLGVDDFRTLDAYHRGKMWYHSAWLHGAGVIWGLRVDLSQVAVVGPDPADPPPPQPLTGEIRVATGAALDGWGRELYLAQDACLDIGAWYAEHADDPAIIEAATVSDDGNVVTLSAHVVMGFNGCLDRQVPALSEPCDGASSTTAYSRVVETVDLQLLPELSRPPAEPPLHRVRLLFGVDEPLLDDDGTPTTDDQSVLDARDAIQALEPQAQAAAWFSWSRHFSVLDTMDWQPDQPDPGEPLSLFPTAKGSPLVLADIADIRLEREGERYRAVAGAVDNHVRQVNLPTTTTQELLTGMHIPTPPSDAGRPRIDPASVSVSGQTLSMTVDRSLNDSTVDNVAFTVSMLTSGGWADLEVDSVDYDDSSLSLEVTLLVAASERPLRLIVRGTGPTPILGSDNTPLAGALAGPPAGMSEGNDFVHIERS